MNVYITIFLLKKDTRTPPEIDYIRPNLNILRHFHTGWAQRIATTSLFTIYLSFDVVTSGVPFQWQTKETDPLHEDLRTFM
jgi:hypothetical protein